MKLSKTLRILFLSSFIFSPMVILTGCSASQVTISEDNISLYVDDTYLLTATSSDEDALVLWESSNNKVAVVRRGKVTAIGKGECDITAYDDNGARKSCHVTVSAIGVSLSHASKEVDLGHLNSFLLTANAEDGGEITWSSSNEDLAVIDENGRVTCLDTGNVTITAYRKGGKATCSVSIFDSSRPEDYYVMSEAKNAVVVANPDTWFYWPNDGSTVDKSIYQNNGFVSNITSIKGEGVYYRYQPGGEFAVNDKYKITFKLMLNVTTTVALPSGKSTNVIANEWTDVTYSGTVKSGEPFHFDIKNVTVPLGGTIVVSVKDIVVSDDHASDYYEVAKGNNATVTSNPGKWYYWSNDNDAASGYYENSQVHVTITKLASDQGLYVRYQPSGFNPGDRYNISYQIMLNVTTTLGGKKSIDVIADEWASFSYTGTFESGTPFNLTVKKSAMPASGNIELYIKNISVTAAHAEDYYEITKGNNATVTSNPGIWYYFTNGSDVATGYYENSQVHVSIAKLENEQGVYFRYQPGNDGTGLVINDKYQISFDVTMNITGKFISGDSQVEVVAANEFVNFSYNGVVKGNEPFQLILKGVEVPSSGSIDVTMKNITITKVLPPVEGYDVVFGTKSTVIANPGKWYYCTNSGDEVSYARYEEDVLNVTISALESPEGIFFRYQPGGSDGSGLAIGNTYTIGFKIMLNITTTIKGVKNVDVVENAWTDYSYTGIVSDTDPFHFDIKDVAVPESGTITISVKEIVLEKGHSADYYLITKGNNAACVADPGHWHVWPNGSTDSFVEENTYFEDGQVHISINKLTHADGMYFRYQPGGSDGSGLVVDDQYHISLKITMNITGTFTGNSSATITTPGEFANYEYDGVVKSNNPFQITLKNVTVPASGTIEVTMKDIVIEKVVPEVGKIALGDKDDAISNLGKWYYSKGSSDVVSDTSEETNSLMISVSTLSSTDGITLYYQPGNNASNGLLLGDDYTLICNVTMNCDGDISGSKELSLIKDGETELSYTGVINATSVFTINLKNISMPSEGDLILNITNLRFKSLRQGNMATVRANPGLWHYNSAGSASFNVVPRISHDISTGTLGVDIKSFAGDHFYFRYQPGGSDETGCVSGDNYRITFKIMCSINASIKYGTKTDNEKTANCEANVLIDASFEGTVTDNIFYIKIDKAINAQIAVIVSNIIVEKI